MPGRKILSRFRRWSIYSTLCATLTLLFVLLAALAFATPAQAATIMNSPNMNVNLGFDARYRDGNWIPVQVSLTNSGPDFTGAVAVNVPSPYYTSDRSTTTYEVPVALATGAQKQVTLYIPLALGISGSTTNIDVNLIDSTGNLVNTQSSTLRALSQGDIFIGLLSNQSNGFGPLNAVTLPNQTASLVVEPLNAGNFPTEAAALKNFDLLILDNFSTSTLSTQQISSLQSWVSQGGTLLIVGGPEWRQTLSPLPASLLPVSISGTTTLPAGAAILPVGSPGNAGTGGKNVNPTLPAPVTISTGQTNANSINILSAKSVPLISEENVGNGQVCYLAFDPTLDPVTNWSNATLLWQGLLFRTLGNAMLAQSPITGPATSSAFNQNSQDISGLVQTFLPNTFPSVTIILAILLGYVLILGPVRSLIVRRFKRRDWNWRIVLASIIVFSLLSYGIALQQKGTSIVSDTISVIQLGYPRESSSASVTGNTSSNANVTTYVGVFVPNQGSYHIHINNDSLVQPESSPFGQTTNQSMIIAPGQNGTDVEMHGVDIWTLHTINVEQQQTVHGGLISHLTLHNGMLEGSVTNALSYKLSDVYVLMGSNYMHLNALNAGQTQQVNLLVNSNTSNSGLLLGEQIANSQGYSNYGSPPQTEEQRHLAMLTAMSGDGPYNCGGNGTCYSSPTYKVTTSNGVIISGNGGPPTVNKEDPLLLENAPATLIGWADNPSDATSPITVNSNVPTGTQEALIQAPLNVNYTGTVSLPSTLLTGQMINAQGQSNSSSTGGVQETLPGIYTMTTGSATFEFTIPTNWQIHVNNATINESSNMNQVIQQTGAANGVVSDISSAQAYLYNWQTQHWDAANVSSSSISIHNPGAYISPDGCLLVQFVNQDATKGTIAFSDPNLQVQGTA